MRIVSLVPSLTHMVCDFGLRGALVGCTKFCVKPPGLQRIATLIGGTKDPDLEAIRSLRPTHILVNEEENKPEHIEACRGIAPTFLSFPKSPHEMPGLLRESGRFLDAADRGEEFAVRSEKALNELKTSVDQALKQGRWLRRRCLYFIWREPYMLASTDTYISSMLDLVKLSNAAPSHSRYPEVSIEEAKVLRADMLLLSTEPYPFRKRDAQRVRDEWPSSPEIWRADGQLFSWYGTLAITAFQALRAWVEGDASNAIMRIMVGGNEQ